jgi:hypothetical protein
MLGLAPVVGALLALPFAAAQQQHPFMVDPAFAPRTGVTASFANGTAPAGPLTLASLHNVDGFTTLAHDRHPGHRVRVKKTDFCDPTVKCAPVLSCGSKQLTRGSVFTPATWTWMTVQSISSSSTSRAATTLPLVRLILSLELRLVS